MEAGPTAIKHRGPTPGAKRSGVGRGPAEGQDPQTQTGVARAGSRALQLDDGAKNFAPLHFVKRLFYIPESDGLTNESVEG